jgi:hypothetical protein
LGASLYLFPETDSMSETSLSLLQRLRVEPDDASWKRLVDL